MSIFQIELFGPEKKEKHCWGQTLWMNPASWASFQRSLAVWPHHAVQSSVIEPCSLIEFRLRPDNHSIRHTQHGGDEAVIPGVTTHKQACNPKHYTNLLWNWLNLQIRLVLRPQQHTHTLYVQINSGKAFDAQFLSETHHWMNKALCLWEPICFFFLS